MNDPYSEPEETSSFAKDLGKTFLLSATAVLGSFAGLIAVGAVASWWSSRQKNDQVIEVTQPE